MRIENKIHIYMIKFVDLLLLLKWLYDLLNFCES